MKRKLYYYRKRILVRKKILCKYFHIEEDENKTIVVKGI
jgi:hypothetical protein